MTLWDLYEKTEREKREVVQEEEISLYKVEKSKEESLYMIGKMLKGILFPGLDFFGCKEGTLDWVWKLVCEYHEKGSCEKIDCRVLSDFNMKHNVVRFTNGNCVEKSPLTKEELLDFFYYRQICCKQKTPDHGIAGGFLLHEMLGTERKRKGEIKEGEFRKICFYAVSTLMCHNAFVYDIERRRSPMQKDPLLCLLLLSESLDPLHLYEEDLEPKTVRKLLCAVKIERVVDGLVITTDPKMISAGLYAEKLFLSAKKIGLSVSFAEKNCKIHIKGVNSADY